MLRFAISIVLSYPGSTDVRVYLGTVKTTFGMYGFSITNVYCACCICVGGLASGKKTRKTAVIAYQADIFSVTYLSEKKVAIYTIKRHVYHQQVYRIVSHRYRRYNICKWLILLEGTTEMKTKQSHEQHVSVKYCSMSDGMSNRRVSCWYTHPSICLSVFLGIQLTFHHCFS